MPGIHLHCARLFGRPIGDGRSPMYAAVNPWPSPQADPAEARRSIEKHGYLRRMGELKDA